MASAVVKNVLFGGRGGQDWPAEVGLLVLRVFTGLMLAFGHGLEKITDPSKFLAGVEKAGFPVPGVSGWLAIGGEFVGGILLAAGFLTRPAALWVVGVMAGAAFVVHGSDPLIAPGAPSMEPPLMYLVPAVCFLLTGSGRTGVDRLLR